MKLDNNFEQKIEELEYTVLDFLAELKKNKHRLLDEFEAADYLGSKASTLRKMRNDGRGPLYSKTQGLGIKYDIRDLDAYIDSLPRRGGGTI